MLPTPQNGVLTIKTRHGGMMDNTKAVEMAELILRGTTKLTDRMVANNDTAALTALAVRLRGFAQALGSTPDINLN